MPFISSVRGSYGAQGRFGRARNPLGLNSSSPASSARAILFNEPTSQSGLYWINDGVDTFQVYCDMTRNGGGWMLVASIRGGNGSEVMATGAAGLTTPVYQPSSTGNWGKFSDERINRIRARSQSQTNGYTGNWPWWVEGVDFTEATAPTGLTGTNRIDMFVYKDAQTFATTTYPGDSGAGSPFSAGTQRPEWRRIRNVYDESTTLYTEAGGTPNYGTRGFGHHHQGSADQTNPRFSWARHPESGGSCAMRADSWGIPTYGHFWVK
jgi:hypothetical protein